MRLFLSAVVFGVWGGSLACSARYDVGVEPDEAGGRAGGGVSSGGTATGGGKAGGTVPGGGGFAGSPLPGTAGASFGPSKCSVAQTASSQPLSQPSQVIWERISRFLFDEVVQPPEPLPARASAKWAGETVARLLAGEVQGVSPEPTAGLARLLREWAPESTAVFFAEQLAAPDARLGTLWALPLSAREPQRLGIMADAALLRTVPTISGRGSWLRRYALCSAIPAPPAGTPTSLEPQPGMTRREQLQSELSDPTCASCHQLTDPPGYSLEHYDALGRYQELDNGLPIDSSGTLQGNDDTFVFADAAELAQQFAVSCDVAHCFAYELQTNALASAGQLSPDNSYAEEGQLEVDRIAGAFVTKNFSIAAALRAVVESPSFLR